ncbi:MAG: hypothetical protein ACYC5A_08865 [Thermoleophilia bacterium]
MGVEYHIEGELVELRVAGDFTIDELLDGFRSMLAEESLPARAQVIIDVTASQVIPSAAVIEQIAAIIDSAREKLAPRLAVLVAQEVRIGKARQLGFMLQGAGIQVEPFYDREAAVNYLASQGD